MRVEIVEENKSLYLREIKPGHYFVVANYPDIIFTIARCETPEGSFLNKDADLIPCVLVGDIKSYMVAGNIHWHHCDAVVMPLKQIAAARFARC